jgi:hypothetical protein
MIPQLSDTTLSASAEQGDDVLAVHKCLRGARDLITIDGKQGPRVSAEIEIAPQFLPRLKNQRDGTKWKLTLSVTHLAIEPPGVALPAHLPCIVVTI